jgi:hypothetical protein
MCPAVLVYLKEREAALADELKATQKALAGARSELASAKAGALAHKAEPLGDYRLLVNRLDGVEGAGGRPNLAQAGGRDGVALV